MIGWQLLLDLLPHPNEVGTSSHAPVFRRWKPVKDSPITWEEFWTFTRSVFDMCLERLAADVTLWPDFAERIDDLPAEYRSEALEMIGRLELDEGELRTALWQQLDQMWRRHREHHDTDWAMPAHDVESVQTLAAKLAPLQPTARHRWLFEGDRPDLGLGHGTDEYEKVLAGLQESALKEVWDKGGLDAVIGFVASVKSPGVVGHVLGDTEHEIPLEVIAPLLGAEDGRRDFAFAFLRRRLYDLPSKAAEVAEPLDGSPIVQARLLLVLDDVETAWTLARELGDAVDHAYWAEFYPYGRGGDFPLANAVARELAAHGRPALALDVFSHYRKGVAPTDFRLVVDVFTQLLREGDEQMSVLSRYDINNLITMLRDADNVSDDEVAQLEWQLLPALSSRANSSTLQRRLAQSPEFFVEVLSLIYRGDDGDGGDDNVDGDDEVNGEASEQKQRMASNAWRLLREWKVLPGTDEDTGEVDAASLGKWIERARALASIVKRAEVADSQIGQMLAQVPVENGADLWPPLAVRQVLEDNPTPAMLRGFSVGAYNKRGATSRGMTEGGVQEYALADRYRAWAEAARIDSPKTSRVLRELADGYMVEGRRNDEDAQRIQENFGL